MLRGIPCGGYAPKYFAPLHRYRVCPEHPAWQSFQKRLTEMIAERAARFVDRNAANPFFLYVPFNAVHWPFQEPGRPDTVRNNETWRDGLRSEYIGMTESMDDAVGRVLDALKRNGLEENTLVIFTNDNGGERLSDSGPPATALA